MCLNLHSQSIGNMSVMKMYVFLPFLWMMGCFVPISCQSNVQPLNIHFPMFHPYSTFPFQNTHHTTTDSTPTVLRIPHLDWGEECLGR